MLFLDSDSGGDGTKTQFLYRPSTQPVHSPIITRKAATSLHNAIADKQTRRALSKALRDSFQWGADEAVTLYSDGGCDFYFTTQSGFPACGGLILHRHETPSGRVKLYYGLHT